MIKKKFKNYAKLKKYIIIEWRQRPRAVFFLFYCLFISGQFNVRAGYNIAPMSVFSKFLTRQFDCRQLFVRGLIVNSFLLKEYAALFFFILVCAALSFVLYFIAKNVNRVGAYNEKLGPYECGFEAFSDARGHVNVQFYVIALLFVIFDVEVIYFLP